jgi:zinc protease
MNAKLHDRILFSGPAHAASSRVLLAGVLAGVLALGCGGTPAEQRGNTLGGQGSGDGHDIADTTDRSGDTRAQDFSARSANLVVQELVFPEEKFRTEQPGAGEPRPFQLPRINRFKLQNGIEVYLIEQHELPIVSIDLNFDGGGRTEPVGKEGLAPVCMDMLTEGTRELDKLAFREALGDTASWINAYANQDTQGLAMGTLSKHFDATFALFRDTLLEPGMRQEELDRMIQRRLDRLKQAKGSPRTVSSRVSGPVLYGDGHFRGRVATEASYQAITLDACKDYHQRFLKPQGARLFVVGDMTEAQVREKFGQPFAQWKGKVPKVAATPRTNPMQGKLFFVNIPGATQSAVTFMHFGPGRKARDYHANEMMAAVLGGSFSSRINMNLRENKGYSYGARGGFNYTRDNGVFNMNSAVRSDTTYQTVLEMLDELEALSSGKRPATQAELDREMNGAILGLPGQFATARQALHQYRELVYHGLPLNYYNSFVDRLGKVTVAQVMKAAKQHLQPGQARIVVVGDASAPLIHRVGDKDVPLLKDGEQVTLLEGLRELVKSGKLGKGELVVLDPDGKVIE